MSIGSRLYDVNTDQATYAERSVSRPPTNIRYAGSIHAGWISSSTCEWFAVPSEAKNGSACRYNTFENLMSC